jgi:O-antigen ligase
MNLSNSFLFFNLFLVILIPPFLISGPFLSDFVCTYIGLFYLIYFIKHKDFSYYKNYYFIFFLFIYLYLNFNSLLSFNPKVSFQSSLAYFRIILFVFSMSYLLQNYKRLNFYFYISCLLCIILLLFGSISDISNSLQYEDRVSSFFGDEKIMGSYVSRILPLIIGISYLLEIPKRDLINLTVLVTGGFLVILSGERTAFIYFCFLLIFYFFLNRKKILIFILLFSSIILVLNQYSSKSIDRIFIHTINQQKNSGHLYSFRHESHILTAYNMYLEKKLFGHGLKSFRNLCNQDQYNTQLDTRKLNFIKNNPNSILPLDISEVINGCSTHPHNIYFQFLSELGLIGFILFFIFFCFLCIKLFCFLKKFYTSEYKINNNYIAENFFLFSLFTSMFPILPSGNYFNNWLLIITYLPLGFYLSLIQKK